MTIHVHTRENGNGKLPLLDLHTFSTCRQPCLSTTIASFSYLTQEPRRATPTPTEKKKPFVFFGTRVLRVEVHLQSLCSCISEFSLLFVCTSSSSGDHLTCAFYSVDTSRAGSKTETPDPKLWTTPRIRSKLIGGVSFTIASIRRT